MTEVSAIADGTSKSLAEAGYTVTYGTETVDHAITITNTDLPVVRGLCSRACGGPCGRVEGDLPAQAAACAQKGVYAAQVARRRR